MYKHPRRDLAILPKNYRLSDDIAFRFSNEAWKEHPLSTGKFAGWLHAHSGNAQVINLFMGLRTFGEHQWEATGIFEFLNALPQDTSCAPRTGSSSFPAGRARHPPVGELSYGRLTSWADQERDVTAVG